MLPVDEVVSRIRRQGGLVYVPHPYDPVRAGVETFPSSNCASNKWWT